METVNVLVVIDTQNDFADESVLGTQEAEASIPHIIHKITECGNAGYIILDTMDTHTDGYLDTNEGRHLPVIHTVEHTRGWDTVSSIRSALDMYHAVDILKDRFGSTSLPHIVKSLAEQKLENTISTGVELTITLIGWCTDICVITNALLLKTAFPEAEIIVNSRCCAGVTPAGHDAALQVMKSCQITVDDVSTYSDPQALPAF